jgi:hypothetical protein
MDLTEYLKLAAWGVGVPSAIFAATSAVTTEDFRRDLGIALKSFNLSQWLKQWPDRSVKLFDEVFGEKHLSVRCIVFSSLFSIFAVLALFFLLLFISGKSVSEWWAYWEPVPPIRIFFGVFFPILLNVITDYVALIETRYVINKIGGGGSAVRIVIFVVLDILATTIIYILSFTILTVYFLGILKQNLGYSTPKFLDLETLFKSFSIATDLVKDWFTGFHIDLAAVNYFEGPVLFYSTFVTSIWIWIMLLTISVTKLFDRFAGRRWLVLRDSILDIEKKPLLSIGWITSSIIFFLFILASPFILTLE